jgi:hypothetical protein
LRQEAAIHKSILPVDNKLIIDLKTIQAQCSVSKALVDPSQLRVIKTNEGFGKLLFLSPNCVA